MKGFYHDDIYSPSLPNSYWWESIKGLARPQTQCLDGDQSCDTVIIGAGYSGLSAGYHLANSSDQKVIILDGAPLGWGASGRNAGFACFPATLLGFEDLFKRYGQEESLRFWRTQLEGVDLLEELAEETHFDFDCVGNGLFEVAHKPNAISHIQAYGEEMRRWMGVETEWLSIDAMKERGHEGSEQFGALHVKKGFALNPMKLTMGLAKAAIDNNVVIYDETPVISWKKEGTQHILETDTGRISSKQVIVATNGYYKDGLHSDLDHRIMPVISNIIVTEPLSDTQLAANRFVTETPCVNSRSILFYYRLLPDRRFLIGTRGDTVGTNEAAKGMQEWLISRFHQLFPGWSDVKIDYFWNGLICMTRDQTPSVGQLDDDSSVFFGFGCHGNGVNTAPWIGKQLGLAACQKVDLRTLPKPINGAGRQFLLPSLRRPILSALLRFKTYTDT